MSPVPVNNLDGVRMSTALTYINPNRYRLNLTIKANVMVTKILFSGKAATGVEVESGEETFVMEGREIVLSAGAIKSPHLLMLSGVGPTDQLNEFGIPVVCELPGVGQNMRDHPQVSMLLQAKDGVQMDPGEATQTSPLECPSRPACTSRPGLAKLDWPRPIPAASLTWTTDTLKTRGTARGCAGPCAYAYDCWRTTLTRTSSLCDSLPRTRNWLPMRPWIAG